MISRKKKHDEKGIRKKRERNNKRNQLFQYKSSGSSQAQLNKVHIHIHQRIPYEQTPEIRQPNRNVCKIN